MPGSGSPHRCFVVGVVLVGVCAVVPSGVQVALAEDSGFHLTSASFQDNGEIPARFTCSGEDLSPALAWTDPPTGTQSFALLVDDPDAPGGVFTHWVLYDLPAGTRELREGVPLTPDPEGGRQSRNDFDKIGYGGPCPPPGSPHRYSFRLYALDKKLSLRSGASKGEVERALKGHVLAQAQMTGHFGR